MGPSASGKTQTCLQRICEIHKSFPLTPVPVLVPDSLQVSAFKKKLINLPDMGGTEVSTFLHFSESVLKRSGSGKLLIENPLINQIIRYVIDRSDEKDRLVYYASILETPGFTKVVAETFIQLEKNLVTPEFFKENAVTVAQTEIFRIFTEYRRFLEESGWVTPAGLLCTVAVMLETQPKLAGNLPLLVIDGFDSFDKDQLRLIRALEPLTGQILITLPGAAGGQESLRFVNRRFTRSLKEIREVFGSSLSITSVEDQIHLPEGISYIVRNVMNPNAAVCPADRSTVEKSVAMIEAGSQEDEVREVLRRIKQWVLREGIPLTSCAVFAPNLAGYAPVYRRLGGEMGIPLNIGIREPLINAPAINALVNLLQLQVRGFRTRALMNCLRSPFFVSGLDPEQVSQVDWISHQMRITGGRDQWEETWVLLCKAEGESAGVDEDGDSIAGLRKIPDSAELSGLRNGLCIYFDVVTPPRESLDEADWVHWLERLLDKVHFSDQLDPDEASDLAALQECFRTILINDRLIKQGKIPYSKFLINLTGILTSSERQNPVGNSTNAVFVGDISWARGVRFQAVALTGFSEGLFPAAVAEDVVLDKVIKKQLGIPPIPNNDQSGLFIQALARSDRKLLISRPTMTDQGDTWEESLYWSAIRRLVPDGIVQRIRSSMRRPLSEAASLNELKFWAAMQGERAGMNSREPILVPDRNNGTEQKYPVVRLADRTAVKQIYSASQLETCLYCPLRYFVSNILMLEPVPEPDFGLDSMQLGSLLHRILQRTFESAEDLNDMEALFVRLDAACNRIFAKAPQMYRFRPSGLWPFEQQQLRRQLKKSVEELLKDSIGWNIKAVEARFGMDGMPCLTIEANGEALKFRGIIDRIDQNNAGNLRVIDYKIGSGHLASSDFYAGRRVQLFLYALAAADVLKLGPVEEGYYWAVLAAKSSSLKLSSFMVPDELDKTGSFRALITEKVTKFHNTLLDAVFPADPIDGTCPAYCSAAAWCGKYIREF